MNEEYIAHIFQDADGNWHKHGIEDHLIGTAKLSGYFASKFNNEGIGFTAGLLHDLGKYKPEFFERIMGNSGYDPDAHVKFVDHSTVSGMWAAGYFKGRSEGAIGRLIAYLIISHHTGLGNKDYMDNRLIKPEELKHISEINKRIGCNVLDLLGTINVSELKNGVGDRELTLFVRMLFSSLVDADSLDTEAFVNPNRSVIRSIYPDRNVITRMYNSVTSYVEEKERNATPTEVNQIRKKVRMAVMEKSQLEPGFFSLNVPTGGGKTLTSLAFALKHADLYRKDRVIYVAPFTSIIDQTAEVFRNALGNDKGMVIEHHSNVQPERVTASNLLLAENWDAPIILTTNVQFYESLFTNKRSRVRKLHNIVNSVIVIDEWHTIPPEFINPILAGLNELVKNYNVTILLCSATQFPHNRVKTVNEFYEGVDNVRELIDSASELHTVTKRFNVCLHGSWPEPVNYTDLSVELRNHRQALVIVNRKDDARELFELITDVNKYHLSTNMCPAHRRDVLNAVKKHIENNEDVKLVSTQLIEAGVDIDFPVVYRAISGIDNIIQAGGRCNREGKLAERGKLVVFIPERPSPPGYLRVVEKAGRCILDRCGSEIGLEQIALYFDNLIWKRGGSDGGGLDKYGISEKQRAGRFEDVGKIRIINDDTTPILVCYKNGIHLCRKLEGIDHINRFFTRELQQYTVSLYRKDFEKLQSAGAIKTINDTFFVLTDESLYLNCTGIKMPAGDTGCEQNIENI